MLISQRVLPRFPSRRPPPAPSLPFQTKKKKKKPFIESRPLFTHPTSFITHTHQWYRYLFVIKEKTALNQMSLTILLYFITEGTWSYCNITTITKDNAAKLHHDSNALLWLQKIYISTMANTSKTLWVCILFNISLQINTWIKHQNDNAFFCFIVVLF